MVSHRLCLATAFIYYHVCNPLSTLFFKLFSILFFRGDRLADDFAILPPPYPFCQHLFSSSFDFFSVGSSFHSFPSLFHSFHSLYSLYSCLWLTSVSHLAAIWLTVGAHLAMTWLLSGSLLVLFWFVISLSHPPECFASAFYFGSGYFGTYCLHKKIPPFYKQNLFIAVIYFLEP